MPQRKTTRTVEVMEAFGLHDMPFLIPQLMPKASPTGLTRWYWKVTLDHLTEVTKGESAKEVSDELAEVMEGVLAEAMVGDLAEAMPCGLLEAMEEEPLEVLMGMLQGVWAIVDKAATPQKS